MWLGLLAALAFAGPPDDFRDDGDLVFGCERLGWLQDQASGAGPASRFLGPVTTSLGFLRQIGADDDGPIWASMALAGARLRPLHLRVAMPGDNPIGMMVRFLPGGPRTRQEGPMLHMAWTPEGEGVDLVPRVRRAEDLDGCVLGLRQERPGGASYTVLALGGPEGRSLQLRLSGDDPAAIPGLPPGWVEGLSSGAEAGWPAFAETPTAPALALRLNAEATPEELLRGVVGGELDTETLDRVVLHPGSEIGLWGLETWQGAYGRRVRVRRAAAVVPVRRPRTVRWWPGRLARTLEKQGTDVVRLGRVVGVPTPQGHLWVTSARGRLILSDDPRTARLLQEHDGGARWFDARADLGPASDPDAPGLVVRTDPTSPELVGRATVDGPDLVLDADLGQPGPVLTALLTLVQPGQAAAPAGGDGPESAP